MEEKNLDSITPINRSTRETDETQITESKLKIMTLFRLVKFQLNTYLKTHTHNDHYIPLYRKLSRCFNILRDILILFYKIVRQFHLFLAFSLVLLYHASKFRD